MQLRKLMVPVVAVALGMAACGDDDSSSGDETPANGDDTGEEASTDDEGADEDDDSGDEAEVDADEETGGDDVDEASLFEAMAAAFVEAGSLEFETIVSAAGQEASVTGAMQLGSDGSPSSMRMSMEQAGVATTMLLVDDQFYIEMTEDMGFPGGGSWLAFSDDADDPLGQQMAGAFDDIGDATDMSAQLAENAEVLTVTEIGSATVDGVETTEYHVVVDDVEAYIGAEGDGGMSELSYTMWLDGDNLPRKISQESDGGAPVEVIYKNYGADVEIEAPPEDEIVDLSEMMNQ